MDALQYLALVETYAQSAARIVGDKARREAAISSAYSNLAVAKLLAERLEWDSRQR